MLLRDKLCGRVVAGSPICIHAESGIAKTEAMRKREGEVLRRSRTSKAAKPNSLESRLVLLHKEAVSNQIRERNDLEKMRFDHEFEM